MQPFSVKKAQELEDYLKGAEAFLWLFVGIIA